MRNILRSRNKSLFNYNKGCLKIEAAFFYYKKTISVQGHYNSGAENLTTTNESSAIFIESFK
jgi:hypothetical protein